MSRLSDWYQELRRRRMFRLVGAYAILAWLLLQIGEVTFEPLGLPEGSMRALIYLVLGGFPIALAIGWVFDWTPAGLERTSPADGPTPRAEDASSSSHLGQAKRLGLVVFAVLAALGAYRGARFWHDVQWAQNVAQPELVRRIELNDFHGAFALASELEDRVGVQPALESVWPLISAQVSFETEPPGAHVSYRRFEDSNTDWTSLGETPIEPVRVPRGPAVWRIEKPGYAPREFARAPGLVPMPEFAWPSRYLLDREDQISSDVVVGEGRRYAQVSLATFPVSPDGYVLDRFTIDRTEVTNADYLEFVRANGYQRPEFWQEPFELGESVLTFAEAMDRFTDATDRPGPATWIAGRPPEGKEEHPVAGVSWFEAMAYARFRDRNLPTAYHWAAAALPDAEIIEPIAPALAAQSHLEGTDTRPVGTTSGLSAVGALDMFGNVSEWVTTARGMERFSLGLGWSDPAYNVSMAQSTSPWSRLATQGFRLADYDEDALAPSLRAPTEAAAFDPDAFEPVRAEELALAFPEIPALPPPIVASRERIELSDGLVAERIEIRTSTNAAEALDLYLLPPEDALPPYGAVIWFTGLNALLDRDDGGLLASRDFLEFIRDSGRLVVMPVWSNTFSKNDGTAFRRFMGAGPTAQELLSTWSRELGRSIDYLTARDDVDPEAVAFVGLSLGSLVGEQITPRNPRLRTAIYWSGGIPSTFSSDGTALMTGLAASSDMPVLMLNGRYDFVFPLDGQRAYFRRLGASEDDRRHVVYEAGHFGWPLGAFVRENLDWLDRYLGPTARRTAVVADATAPKQRRE